jgi:hypothetical protein
LKVEAAVRELELAGPEVSGYELVAVVAADKHLVWPTCSGMRQEVEMVDVEQRFDAVGEVLDIRYEIEPDCCGKWIRWQK